MVDLDPVLGQQGRPAHRQQGMSTVEVAQDILQDILQMNLRQRYHQPRRRDHNPHPQHEEVAIVANMVSTGLHYFR